MNYNEITGSFPSSDKKSEIYYRICTPCDMPKGIIQISHGMCEYFDRYDSFVDYFTKKGFIVCGNDHIGHGKSVKSKEDLGYFGEGNYELLAQDLYQLNRILRQKYRSLPYILLGHSMGSFVVRDYITRYPDSVDGTIICGTSGTNKAVSAGIFLCTLLSKLRGPRYRSIFVRNTAFKGYNSHFADEKDVCSWLTREPDVRLTYHEDPLCNYTFTLDGYKNMFSLLKKVSAEGWEEKVPKSMPILIISGKEDPVGNYGEGVMEVYDRLEASAVNMLKIKLYPEARHELFNERNREEVFGDVEDFVKEVIDGVLEARGYGRY